jgi:hypothetical protein
VVDQRRASLSVVHTGRGAPALIIAEVTFMKRGKRPTGTEKAHKRSEMIFVGF